VWRGEVVRERKARKQDAPETKPMDRRHKAVLSRRSPKRQRVTWVIIGVSLLLVAGVLIAGYIIQFVLPPREVIIKVGEASYTRGDLVKNLRVQQRGAEFFGLEFKASTQVFESLQGIIEDEIMSQSSARFGVSVAEEEITGQIERLFKPAPDQSGEDEAARDREFRERYSSYLNAVGLSESEHREITRRSILRAKFREFIGEQVPGVASQIHYYRIVMDVGDEMDIMQTKAKDGLQGATTPEERAAVFKEIVREFSRDDAETIRVGGDMGWLPMGTDERYTEQLFALKMGELSPPTPDADNPRRTFFFMVSEVAEARELDPEDRESLKTRALQDWINQQRQDHEVFAAFDSDIYSWLLKQLRLTGIETPTPTPGVGIQLPGA
jgi:hypothetical protein